MKKTSTLLQTEILATDSQPSDDELRDMQPKEETIDFLMKFAAAYNVEKLPGKNVYAEFILN